jgi:hypothetical protein
MDGQDGQDRVKAVVSERQSFRTSLNARRCVCRTLGNHRQGRLSGDNQSGSRLIGTCASAYVQNGSTSSKGDFDSRSNSRIALPSTGIRPSDTVVNVYHGYLSKTIAPTIRFRLYLCNRSDCKRTVTRRLRVEGGSTADFPTDGQQALRVARFLPVNAGAGMRAEV